MASIPSCDHPRKSSRCRFYTTLFAYSSNPDSIVLEDCYNIHKSNEPVTIEEKEMMQEWVAICNFGNAALDLRAIVDIPKGSKRYNDTARDRHRLFLFSRDQDINPIEYIECHRELTYSCGCNDTRCICGEASRLTYIYNIKTHSVLTVGSRCVERVDMASVDYHRCAHCFRENRYSITNLGLCPDCRKDQKVLSGKWNGRNLDEVAMMNYDPYTDTTVSFVDLIRILEMRSRVEAEERNHHTIANVPTAHIIEERELCNHCGLYLHRGMRGEGMEGWKDEDLCSRCFLDTVQLSTGDEVINVALAPYSRDTISSMNGRDQSIVAYAKYIYDSEYMNSHNDIVNVGTHQGKRYRVIISSHREYIDKLRRHGDGVSSSMLSLLAYADLYDMLVPTCKWKLQNGSR